MRRCKYNFSNSAPNAQSACGISSVMSFVRNQFETSKAFILKVMEHVNLKKLFYFLWIKDTSKNLHDAENNRHLQIVNVDRN